MVKKVNNKKLILTLIIILLLVLAVGYAVFSESLTILGTANAKGTFDLEFQNVEIVKNIGADKEKTTAEISADKNTLTVNVGDLAYPGAGVEFSVDIVNVGTMPAEVQAVTPNNITGSDKIKVTGLDEIKVGHPKIEVGNRCNIHFTVEWPEDVIELSKVESTISFGLQIEYTQSIGEVFEGEVYHTDLDKEGNTIRTDRVKKGTLTEIITAEDYGKSINYKATVKNNNTNQNEEVSNWKVLYNDKSNIYLILDDFLPVSLVPDETGLAIKGEYHVYSNTSGDALLNGLKTESFWSEFANGIEEAIAQGTPPLEILISSYNEKYGTSFNTDSTIHTTITLDNTDKLYVTHDANYNEVVGYNLANMLNSNTQRIWHVNYLGTVNTHAYYHENLGIRPMVKLPTTVEGTVGEIVEIK